MKIVILMVVGALSFVSQAAYHGKTGKVPLNSVPGVYRDDDDYLLRKFREDVSDRLTGLDNAAIDCSEHDLFPAFACWNRYAVCGWRVPFGDLACAGRRKGGGELSQGVGAGEG